MTLRGFATPWVVLAGVGFASGCGGAEQAGEEVPFALRVQFETQMKTVLHDLKAAQEQAAAYEGKYLELDELRGRYLNRPLPEGYDLTLSDVSATGYRADVVHRASGLRCHLLEGGSGQRGLPTCGEAP